MQQMTVSTKGEFKQSSNETGSGRPSIEEYPSSCFELRPQKACLYIIYNEGTIEESECYKMPLTDEQVNEVAEIFTSPNSLDQLVKVVPKCKSIWMRALTRLRIYLQWSPMVVVVPLLSARHLGCHHLILHRLHPSRVWTSKL